MSLKFSTKSQFKKKLEVYRIDLFRVAYSWCHDPELANELSQETLLKALVNADKLKDIDAMKSWLFRIMRNCWHDNHKKLRINEDIDNHINILVLEDISEEHIYQHQIKQRVKLAVKKLSEEQRQAVTLIDLTSMSYTEAAEALEIPIGTLMSRLHRARKRLQVYLQDLDINPATKHTTIRRVK